jgi:parallel beta-helix repeat protein
MKKIILLTLVGLLSLLIIGNARAGITYLSDCAEFKNAGETYILTTDINTTQQYCFIGNTSYGIYDSILDCQGHTISGNGSSSLSYAVYINGPDSITIKNCNFINWFIAIGIGNWYYSYNSNNIQLINNSFSSCLAGVSIQSSKSNIIVNNTFKTIESGISLSWNEGNTIDNNTFYGMQYGINLYGSGNVISNNLFDSNGYGVQATYSAMALDNVITNNKFVLNTRAVEMHGYGNSITNNIFDSNGYGISVGKTYSWLSNMTNETIANNIIVNSTNYGIGLGMASNNLIYNNLLNNTVNWYFGGIIFPNYWNTTKTAGTNIIGGSYIGGNYWTNPTNNGYSNTCTDADSDGFCDNPYVYNEDNKDYLPLAYYIPGPTTTSTVPTTITTTVPTTVTTTSTIITTTISYDELVERIEDLENRTTTLESIVNSLKNYVNKIICDLLPRGLMKDVTCPVY